MTITVNGKTYTIEKMNRKKKKLYTDEFYRILEIQKKLEKGVPVEITDDDLIGEMYETLVKLYDHQFTVEELDEEDVTDMTFAFMSIQIELEEKLNKKADEAKKVFKKGKK